MVERVCSKCNKVFTHKGAYDRHLLRKIQCTNLQESAKKLAKKCKKTKKNTTITMVDDDNLECKFCRKSYSRKYELKRHLKNGCKNQSNTEIQNVYEELQKMKDEMEKIKNTTLPQHIMNNTTNNNTINNNTTNNTTNNTNNIQNIQQNNIIINMYGKEDLSHLTFKDFKSLFKRCNSCIQTFIELIHYNELKPENGNVYISNLRSGYAMVFDGENWNMADQNKTVSEMYDNKCELLLGKFADLKDRLDPMTLTKFGRFIDKYEDDEMKKMSEKEIKLVLYNKRNQIIKNK